jgi:beta-phosphoglucomutase-like phosphatase (HAD superfamily)
MLKTLRKGGHILAAVWADTTSKLEKSLKDTRVRDYFEDDIFGYDRRDLARSGDLSYVGLYRTVTRQEGVAPADTLVVADDPVGIEEATYIKPRAVIGYVPTADDHQSRKLKELEAAGANYAVTSANDVAVMPWLFSGVYKMQ